jgi:regulator of sirC expression with transglutaminase-like and TPR domain
MGLSHAALGDTAIAIETLNTFVANSNDSTRIEYAVERIEQLRGGQIINEVNEGTNGRKL